MKTESSENNTLSSSVLLSERRKLNQTAFAAGVVGGVLMSVVMLLIRASGASNLNLEMSLGNLITGKLSLATWLLGFGMHLLIAGLFGLVYGAVFRAVERSSTRLGILIAVANWSVVGLVLGAVKRTTAGFIEPGYYGINYGTVGFFEIFFVHLLFGATVGFLFAHARRRSQTIARGDLLGPATSPLADSLGQADNSFEDYKKKRA